MFGLHERVIWQGAFLLGLSVSIIIGSVVLGTLFTPLLVAITAVLTIINSLLNSSREPAKANTLVSLLKRALNVTALLKFSTIIIWLTVFGFIGYILWGSYRAAQKINLEGHVITAGGDPADEAVVVVTVKGQEVMTTTANGKFSIEIDLSGTQGKVVPLMARWHGLEASTTVDLSGGSPKGLVINLPPGPMPLRVSYFLVGGFTIDFLMTGQIDKKWEEKLAGQPYIIPNNVFQALSALVSSFAGEFDHDLFLLDTKTKTDENVGDLGVGSSFFVGTWRPKYFERPIFRNDLLSVLNQGWNVQASASDVGSGNLRSVSFWKFLDRADLTRFLDLPKGYNRNEWVRFYSFITKDYFPPDFCYASIYLNFCGDILTEALYSRVLQLRVALIENNSSHPVRIGKFQQRENQTDRLRSRESDQAALSTSVSKEEEIFARGILNPGEKILVPIEMTFVFEKELQERLHGLLMKSSNTTMRDDLMRLLSKPELLKIPVNDGTFEITNNDVLNSLSTPLPQLRLEREYTYGHSLLLQSLEVDKVRYEFRKFDPDKLVLHAGDESGSCPYIFARSNESEIWTNQGEILFGSRGKSKESRDTKQLSAFDGTLLIRENDAEESFIDYLYVRTFDTAGNEIRLYPRNEKLRSEDGNYMRLEQGQQLEVQFQPHAHLNDRKWSVVAKGYYQPFPKR